MPARNEGYGTVPTVFAPAFRKLLGGAAIALALTLSPLQSRAAPVSPPPIADLASSSEASSVVLPHSGDENDAAPNRRVIVGVLEGMAPLMSRSDRNDKARGLAADYLDIIARARNLSAGVRFYDNLAALSAALAAGEIDAAVGADAMLPPAQYPRSAPIFSAAAVVITRSEARNTNALGKGTLGYLRTELDTSAVQGRLPDVPLQAVDSYYEGLERVATHKDVAFLGDTVSISAYNNAILFYMLKARPSTTGLRTQYHFVFNPQRADLLRVFDEALGTVPPRAQATLQRRWVLAEQGRLDGKVNFTDAELQWIKDHPKVSVAASALVIPFTFRDSFGRAAGISSSVLDLISAQTGLVFTHEFYDSALDQLNAVRAGQADMASTMQGNYPDFSGLLTSRPILRTTYALISRPDGPRPRDFSELAPLRVALVAASPLKSLLASSSSGRSPVVVPVSTGLAALNAVATGEADATVLLYPSAEYLITRFYQGQLLITGIAKPDMVPFVYPVSDRAPLLASIIDKVLDAITDDQMEFIIGQWQYSEQLEFRWAARGPLIRGLIIAGSIAAVLVAAWLLILLVRFMNRRRNDRLMQERLTLKRQMLDANPNPMYVWNPDGVMIACNEAFEKLVKDPIVDMNLTLEGIATLDDESRQKIRQAYDEVKATRQPYFAEMTLTLGGRELTGQHWVVPLLAADGEIQALLGGWVDLTELKATERSLQLAIQHADAANRAKMLFLATISHEIRTPMNIVVGALELLKEGKAGDVSLPAQRQAALAYDSATALLLLLNDILHYSKIEAGEVSLHFSSNDLTETLPRWVAAFDRSAEAKHISLTTRVAPDVPTELVFDAGRLRQIVNNLVANAIKFTPEGEVTVTASLGRQGKDWCVVHIAVQDTGIGIAADVVPQLFSPFQQATASTYERYGGTGMGLAISKKLAALFGGEISLQSTEGQGTTVTVTLPMRHGNTWSVPAAPESGTVEQFPALGLPATSTVLIVDDHPSNRMLLETQLRLLGLQVISASSGPQALDALHHAWKHDHGAGGIAAVITDCTMPGMDGYTLALEIAAGAAARGLRKPPIIGYSADGTATAHRRCLESGMLGLLVKPVELNTLRAALLGPPETLVQTAAEASPHAPAAPSQEPAVSPSSEYLDNLVTVFGTPEKARQFVATFLDLFSQDLEDLAALLPLNHDGKLHDWIHRAKGSTHAVQHLGLIECVARFSGAIRMADAAGREAIGAAFIAECRQIMAKMREQADSGPASGIISSDHIP
nr:ATP-binding protein [Achromobacter sp. UMC71]